MTQLYFFVFAMLTQSCTTSNLNVVVYYLRNVPDGCGLHDVPDDELPDSLILGAGLKDGIKMVNVRIRTTY